MITNLAIATVWTTDQVRSRDFFTEKLGFEIRDDIELHEDMRWITVGVPGQPDVMLALMRTNGPGLDPESAEALTMLVNKGVLGAGAFHTDDCRATYEKLRANGVDFVQEPQERPYGVEAIFRDDSGNWYSLTQTREGGLDHSKPWS